MTRIIWLALALPSAALAGWQDDVAASIDACTVAPAPCDAVDRVAIRETRAGHWMIQDEALNDPAVAGPLLNRLIDETEPQLRGALAGALVDVLRDGDPGWHPAWIELATTEADPNVRSILVRGLRRAPIEVAGPALRAALAHPSVETRTDAADTMGGHASIATFVDDLLATSEAPEPTLRAAVVRALGYSGDPKALQAVTRLLQDDDAAVQARAVTALGRLQ